MLADDSGLQYLGGGQSYLTMSTLALNLNIKHLGDILVCSTWVGSITFYHVQAKSEIIKKIKSYSGLQYLRWGSIIFHHVQVKFVL